jgi:hypothetical protein
VSTPPASDCFGASYADARQRFLGACADAGADVASQRHPLAGPDGGALFLDVARLGAADARRTLLVASGTHGVEGFCGSGLQSFLLRDGLAARIPPGVALVLVHAVNPWGFAWLRRVNEDNVDVNRNFLDHAAPHPQNPDYDALYDWLNPSSLDAETVATCVAELQRFQSERGHLAAYRALSGGQYLHPRGVQYGGRAPVWSNRVLRDVWLRHAGASVDVAGYVDLHSGLGPRGVGLLLQTAAAESAAAELAKAWWPDVIRTEPAAGGDAALVSGLIGPAFVASRAAPSVGLVLEFGTLDMQQVILAVQADNWLHHHGERESARGRAIARQMRDAFFLEDDDWQEKICLRAREVLERGLAGLAEARP